MGLSVKKAGLLQHKSRKPVENEGSRVSDRIFFVDRTVPYAEVEAGTGLPGNDNWGTWNGLSLEIVDVPDPGQKVTLILHEFLHWAFGETGIMATMSAALGSKEAASAIEEGLVRSVSSCIFMLLRDNPQLADYINALLVDARKQLKERLNG